MFCVCVVNTKNVRICECISAKIPENGTLFCQKEPIEGYVSRLALDTPYSLIQMYVYPQGFNTYLPLLFSTDKIPDQINLILSETNTIIGVKTF